MPNADIEVGAAHVHTMFRTLMHKAYQEEPKIQTWLADLPSPVIEDMVWRCCFVDALQADEASAAAADGELSAGTDATADGQAGTAGATSTTTGDRPEPSPIQPIRYTGPGDVHVVVRRRVPVLCVRSCRCGPMLSSCFSFFFFFFSFLFSFLFSFFFFLCHVFLLILGYCCPKCPVLHAPPGAALSSHRRLLVPVPSTWL